MISQTVFRSDQWVAANDDMAAGNVELGVAALALIAALSLTAAVLFPGYIALLGLLF